MSRNFLLLYDPGINDPAGSQPTFIVVVRVEDSGLIGRDPGHVESAIVGVVVNGARSQAHLLLPFCFFLLVVLGLDFFPELVLLLHSEIAQVGAPAAFVAQAVFLDDGIILVGAGLCSIVGMILLWLESLVLKVLKSIVRLAHCEAHVDELVGVEASSLGIVLEAYDLLPWLCFLDLNL